MKRLILYIFLLAAALWTGCQKIDVDEPVTGTPVFYADLTVGNMEKNWKAGEDGYYMFAAFEKNSNDVFVFTSSLRKESCPSLQCSESLNIFIRDFQQTPSGNPDVASALMQAFKFFSQVTGDTTWIDSTIVSSYNVQFDASPSIYPPSAFPVFSWNLGNGNMPNNVINPSATYSSLDPPVPVSLTVVASNTGCLGTQVQHIRPDANPSGSSNCSVQVKYDSVDAHLYAQATGTAPFSYTWLGGVTSDSFLQINPPQINAAVTITDANGCMASTSVIFNNSFGALPQFCFAGFTYSITETDTVIQVPVYQLDPFQFSTVIIEYVDEQGTPFTSAGVQQDASAYFEIVSVEDYEENENGEKTKKLTVKFACKVEGNGAVKPISGEAVIAVAYPN